MKVARIVYPVAVCGFAVAAVLNAITWLPIDVSGLTPVWVALFIGIFPVWLVAILVISPEARDSWATQGPRRWYQARRSLSWRQIVRGVPPWMLAVGVVVVVYVFANFFASIALLPGQPEATGGQYYFDVHGRHVATDLPGYLEGLRREMRIFTGHPMVFYGVAALVMYGRRRPLATRE